MNQKGIGQVLIVLVIAVLVIAAIGYLIVFHSNSLITVKQTIPPVSTSISPSSWSIYENTYPPFKVNYPPDWKYQLPTEGKTVVSKITFSPKDSKISRPNEIILRIDNRNGAKDLNEWVNTYLIPEIKKTPTEGENVSYKKINGKDIAYTTVNLPFPPKGKIEIYSILSNKYVFSFKGIVGMAPGIKEQMIQSLEL